MGRNIDYSHLVQAFFDNEMSVEERMDFEQLIDKDPSLQEEYQLQKDIIEEIREHRKQELKNHLSTINAGGLIQWTSALRWATAGVASLVVATGIYFFYPSSEGNLIPLVDLTIGQTEVHIPPVPAQPIAEFTPIVEESVTGLSETETQDQAEENLVEAEIESDVAEAVVNPVPVFTNASPEVSWPALETQTGDITIPEEETVLPGEVFNRPHASEDEKIAVEPTPSRRYSFHYQFYNNKLYLYGDYDDMPYEIIEYNRIEGRQFYLFYQNKYYQVVQGERKITPLKEITNQSLISELTKLRN